MNAHRIRLRGASGALGCVLALATVVGLPAARAQAVDDPFEPVNRAVFEFNDAFDRTVMKPVAETYVAVVPSPVRLAVSNFFGNVNDLFTGVNNLLQGKPEPAVHDFGRVMVNTFLGLGGLIDVASAAAIERHEEDFGQTFGWWGIGPGPYLVLPFLGPSNVRDTTGIAVRFWADPVYVSNEGANAGLIVLSFTDIRARALGTETVIEQAALDKYRFVRRGFLQRRRYLIYDGSPPPLDEEEE